MMDDSNSMSLSTGDYAYLTRCEINHQRCWCWGTSVSVFI